MATKNPTGQGAGEPPTPAQQDLRDQAVVLTQVLSNWPVHLTVDDLVREITTDPKDFAERDHVERAVRDLAGVGLLHRQGKLVLASRAAIHFNRLPFD
jgi:hypothetical protein